MLDLRMIVYNTLFHCCVYIYIYIECIYTYKHMNHGPFMFG